MVRKKILLENSDELKKKVSLTVKECQVTHKVITKYK